MLKNPLLQQAMAHVEKNVDNKDAFGKLMSAGLQTIYDKNLFPQLTKGLPQSKDPATDTAKGIVGVMNLMAKKARGTAPPDAVVQAGFALMLDALDFEEQAGLIKVDKDMLAHATQAYMEAVLPSVGLTPGRLSTALSQVQQTASDPQRLAQLQSAIGGA